MTTTYNIVFLYFTAIITVSLAIYAYRQRESPGAKSLAGLILSMSIWACAYAFELNGVTTHQQIYWMKIKYFGILALPVLYLIFALQYSSQYKRNKARHIPLIIAVIPLISLILIWTNEQHQMFWQDITQIPIKTGYLLSLKYGPAFWFQAFYSYSLILLSAWVVFQELRNRYARTRRGVVAILVSLLVPLAANLLSVLPILPSPRLDFTPYAFTVTAAVIWWLVIKLHFLEITPVAHQMIIDNMNEGLLIVDIQGRIVYANIAAKSLIESANDRLVGSPINKIIKNWAEIESQSTSEYFNEASKSINFDLLLDHCDSQRHLTVNIAPLEDPYGIFDGQLVTLRDTSDQKGTERILRRQLDELTCLHAVATACVEAKQEDTLIEKVTRIIGDSFYPNNFGVMLVNLETQLLQTHATYRESEVVQDRPIPLGHGITGRVVHEGKALNVSDVSQEPTYIETDPSTKSELCVPLKVGERIVGVINTESANIGAFSEQDERLLSIIAGLLSTAIERLRAEDGIQQRVQELQAITHISSELSSVLDREQLLETIARHAVEISSSDACGIFTLHSNGRLYLAAKYGVGDEFATILSTNGVPTEGTAVGQAYTQRRPCQISDIYHSNEKYGTLEVAEMEGIKSVLAIPMQRGEEVIGGIVLWHRQVRRFSHEEERFLQALANQSVNAVENARLFAQERQQRKLEEVLRESGTALSSSLDFHSVIDRLLEQLARFVPYDAANVMWVNGTHVTFARLRGYENFGQKYLQKTQSLRLEISTTENLRLMMETRKPAFISDVSLNGRWLNLIEDSPVRSWAGAPIIINNQVAAFFGLDSRTKNFFKAEHLKPLEIYASQAGLALQNALLFEETQHQLSEITLLSKIIQLTTEVKEPETNLNRACQEIANFFNSQQVGLAMLQPELDQISVIAEYMSDAPPDLVSIPIPASNMLIMAYLLEHQNSASVADIHEEPLLEPLCDLFRLKATTSAMIIPLLSHGEVIGIMTIGSVKERSFSQDEIELTQNIARQVSQSLERLQLFKSARTQAERMADLAILGGELNRPMSMDEVIEGIGRGAMALGRSKRAAIYIREPNDQVLCPWHEGLSISYVRAVTKSYQNLPGGMLLQQAEALLIPDIKDLPEQSPLRLLAENELYHGIGLFPLIYEGSVIAAIGLYYDLPQSWPESLREIMLAFSRQAAIALQNARLFDETHRRALQQEALNEVIAAGVNAPDLPYLLNTVLDLTLHALGMNQGAIWVNEHHVIRGFPEDIGIQSRRISQSRKETTPQTTVINSLDQEKPTEVTHQWKEHLLKHHVHAMLAVPVISGGNRIGAISIASPSPKNWSQEEIALAEAVGRQIGSAAERLDLVARSQEQARQIQQIIDTVPEGVLVIDPSHQVILANPAAQNYLGVLNSGQPRIPDSDQPAQSKLDQLGDVSIEELLTPNTEKSWRELHTDRNSERIFEIAVRPLEANNNRGGWVVVLRDVTTEREEQARSQMRERLATVGQLAAGIAHDFNNIMTAIVVYADLLSLEPALSIDGRDRLITIQQQIERATDLIRQILDFSRRSVMERSLLDLLPFIKELDKLLGRVLPENIKRELKFESGRFTVNADPTHLTQVFMNLALNARDAMPSGGYLRISMSHLALSPGDPFPNPDLSPGNWACLSISDSGTGIPPEVLPHIFDPFFTTKPIGKGTGLGLAQVYGIVQQHGGAINVQSSILEGTTFRIYLPEIESLVESGNGTATVTTLKGSGETLLLVEDDAPAREALEELLESQDYNILLAKNGKEALQIYNEHADHLDMIISDVVMPEMGGIELYYSLTTVQPEIKFLLITGHPLDIEDQLPLEKGLVQWLYKPFTVQELMDSVKTLLEGAPA